MGEKQKLRLTYAKQNKNIKHMTVYCAPTYTN